MNNKIKEHRLNQLGNIKLTAGQKNRIAKLCKCTTNNVEAVLSNQYEAINYKILYFTLEVIYLVVGCMVLNKNLSQLKTLKSC